MNIVADTASIAGVRSRRTQDSRAKLLGAARRLFVERGYHATRPQDISREAGLGHGTFYLHFADKQACFLAFVEDARAELNASLRVHLDGAADMETAVRGSLKAIHAYGAANPGVLPTAMTDASIIAADEASGPTLVDSWAGQWGAMLIKHAQKEGATAPSLEEAGVIGAAIVGIIHEGSAYAARRNLSSPQIVELLTQMILKSIR